MNDVVASIALAATGPGTLDYPDGFADAYAREDQKKVIKVIDWLNATQSAEDESGRWSQARLAKAAGIKQSLFNQVLNGKYTSPPTQHLDSALDAIRRQGHRKRAQIREVPHVHTSVHNRVYSACYRAHNYASFCVVAGAVGIGKSKALRHYAEHEANVFYILAMQSMPPGYLLDQLMEQTEATAKTTSRFGRGTQLQRLAAVGEALTGRYALVILDEAERASPTALEHLRWLRETAKIGVVLAGNDGLHHMLEPKKGALHEQISSRTVYNPDPMRAINAADAYALIRAAFEVYEDPAPSDEILDAFWQVCDGSARRLVENIIPAVRDYGLRKALPLTTQLVFGAAHEILGWSAPKKRTGGAA